jgi:hypothetical protein
LCGSGTEFAAKRSRISAFVPRFQPGFLLMSPRILLALVWPGLCQPFTRFATKGRSTVIVRLPEVNSAFAWWCIGTVAMWQHTVNKREQQLHQEYLTRLRLKDRKYFHTPTGTVGPLERGLIKAETQRPGHHQEPPEYAREVPPTHGARGKGWNWRRIRTGPACRAGDHARADLSTAP